MEDDRVGSGADEVDEPVVVQIHDGEGDARTCALGRLQGRRIDRGEPAPSVVGVEQGRCEVASQEDVEVPVSVEILDDGPSAVTPLGQAEHAHRVFLDGRQPALASDLGESVDPNVGLVAVPKDRLVVLFEEGTRGWGAGP